jgi:hypothetical protein
VHGLGVDHHDQHWTYRGFHGGKRSSDQSRRPEVATPTKSATYGKFI